MPVLPMILALAAATGSEPPAAPGWRFAGPSVTAPLRAAGTTIRMPAYKGLSLTIQLPPSDAPSGAMLTVASAAKGDIGPWAGESFPLDYRSFLYLKLVNRGAPVRLAPGGWVTVTIAGSTPFVAPCSAAHFDFATGEWPAFPDGAARGTTFVERIAAAAFGTIPSGERYLSFECASP